jgi:CMP-N-acetylneuraminic acid synthetase/spore coat polysaccharide biosynthesis predicted glycosyltransferase SpsG
MSMPFTICVIAARSGSKGIPRKNLKLFNGKPLILNMLDIAIETGAFSVIVVTSDSEEILDLCGTRKDVVLHRRCKELSDDQTPLDPVILDASKHHIRGKGSRIVSLQPTSPLLKAKTIIAALEIFDELKCDTLVSVRRDSHLRWALDANGTAVPLFGSRLNRQYAPKEYVETGAFVICNSDAIERGTRFGKKVELFPTEYPESIDVDTPIDWDVASRHSTRSKILFNVVGGTELGFGHLYNAIAVADFMPEYECIFAVPPNSCQALSFLQSFNYRVEQVRSQDLAMFCSKEQVRVLINDCLDTTKEFMTSVRPYVNHIVNFEDLGHGSMYADLVFNALYYDSYPLDNHFYGPEYFLLRPEFYALSVNRRFYLRDVVSDVLICFGGTDPSCLTLKVLNSIHSICRERKINITVVLGPGSKSSDFISEPRFADVKFLQSVTNMAALMAQADLAFSAAGRSVVELGFCGTPSIVLAQNSRELLHTCVLPTNGVVNMGLGAEIDETIISDIFSSLIDSSSRRQTMIDNLRSSFQNISQHAVGDKIRTLLQNP